MELPIWFSSSIIRTPSQLSKLLILLRSLIYKIAKLVQVLNSQNYKFGSGPLMADFRICSGPQHNYHVDSVAAFTAILFSFSFLWHCSCSGQGSASDDSYSFVFCIHATMLFELLGFFPENCCFFNFWTKTNWLSFQTFIPTRFDTNTIIFVLLDLNRLKIRSTHANRQTEELLHI